MFPQYGELRPINGWDLLVSLGHPSKFQPVSRLAFVTARHHSLEANQTLHVWPSPGLLHHIYIFEGSCLLTEFCRVQNSLYVQVLRSPILAVLLHGTPTAVVSQTLRHGTKNGITELSQRGPPIFGRAAITLSIGPNSSFCKCSCPTQCWAEHKLAEIWKHKGLGTKVKEFSVSFWIKHGSIF